jgi:hypothetical protein
MMTLALMAHQLALSITIVVTFVHFSFYMVFASLYPGSVGPLDLPLWWSWFVIGAGMLYTLAWGIEDAIVLTTSNGTFSRLRGGLYFAIAIVTLITFIITAVYFGYVLYYMLQISGPPKTWVLWVFATVMMVFHILDAGVYLLQGFTNVTFGEEGAESFLPTATSFIERQVPTALRRRFREHKRD